jgi:hypothetical protein
MTDFEVNRELAREYVAEGLFEGDEVILEDRVAPAYTGHVGNSEFDREELTTVFAPDVAAIVSVFDDPELVVHHVVAENDRVVVVTTITESGVPVFDLTVVVRIEDGDLVEAWHHGVTLFANVVDEDERFDEWVESDQEAPLGSGSIEWPTPPEDPRKKD